MSNQGMDITARTEARLTELEIKASFAEDLLEQLNQTIYRQQQHIDQLTQAVQQLRQQLPRPGDGEGAARNLRDELPPHY
jgi:SlyX protein